ncbi:MAG: hypothetical protein EBU84_12970 [Actinobacteria bacterium]|nr:hypothetical protein [Actinomycetota bacterium]
MRRIQFGSWVFFELSDPDSHIPFNSWHQLEYLPTVKTIESVSSSAMWVVSPDYVQYIWGVLIDDDADSFESDLERIDAKSLDQIQLKLSVTERLRMIGRHCESSASTRTQISDKAISYRPHLGIFVVAEAGAPIHEPLIGLPGVSGSSQFGPNEVGSEQPEFVTVYWLDDDPVDIALALIKALRDQGEAARNVVYATTAETIYPWEWDWFEECRS